MPRFLLRKGNKQLRFGDLRGFDSESQAAFAALDTTYVCAYKGKEWKKADKTIFYEKTKKSLFENGLCPAFRADFIILDKQTKAFKGFGICGAIADVDSANKITCRECFFEKQLTPAEAFIIKLKRFGLLETYA